MNQNYDNYEIVIVDDGSTDNTEQVIKSFNSEKIRYIKKVNEGRPKTRNRLVFEAKGEFILWLDDDDLLAENLVKLYADIINNKTSIDVIYGNLQIFDSDSKKLLQILEPDDYTLNSNKILSNLIKGKGLTFGGSLIRKSLIEKVGCFDQDFLRAQDSELWTRIACKAKFFKINEIVYYYRKHNENISFMQFVDRSYESMIIRKILAKNNPSAIFPISQLE